MEALAAARSMRGSIGMLAMAWLMAPETLEAAAAAGLETETNGAYAVGRLGVLGDCPPDNVVAGAYFWQPDRMRAMVAAGRASATPAAGAAVYTDICRAWGEVHLTGMDGGTPRRAARDRRRRGLAARRPDLRRLARSAPAVRARPGEDDAARPGHA